MSLKPFQQLKAVAIPIAQANFDTDQITPARYLQKPRSDDFSQYLFRDLRYRDDGSINDDFVINKKEYRQGQIIVTRTNFGCGSSREHAVWALHDYGIKVIIAPGFADIFASNALKNGLLLITLPVDVVEALLKTLHEKPGSEIEVNLIKQILCLAGEPVIHFVIDAFAKECLLNGIDELEYTLSKIQEIEAFEHARETLA